MALSVAGRVGLSRPGAVRPTLLKAAREEAPRRNAASFGWFKPPLSSAVNRTYERGAWWRRGQPHRPLPESCFVVIIGLDGPVCSLAFPSFVFPFARRGSGQSCLPQGHYAPPGAAQRARRGRVLAEVTDYFSQRREAGPVEGAIYRLRLQLRRSRPKRLVCYSCG